MAGRRCCISMLMPPAPNLRPPTKAPGGDFRWSVATHSRGAIGKNIDREGNCILRLHPAGVRPLHRRSRRTRQSVHWSRSDPAAVCERPTARSPWLHEISGPGLKGANPKQVRGFWLRVSPDINRGPAVIVTVMKLPPPWVLRWGEGLTHHYDKGSLQ